MVVFGESGVGKSSLINLILESSAAKTSPDADPCTTRNEQYDTLIHGKKFKIWDTPGVNEGSLGVVRAAIAERSLKQLLRKLLERNELSLLVYCVRASRATQALVRHYRKFCPLVHKSAIPVVIAVTALENSSGDMEGWWQKNAEKLSGFGMTFADHACITTIGDDPRDSIVVRTRRTDSQQAIRELVFRNSLIQDPPGNLVVGDGSGQRHGTPKSRALTVIIFLASLLRTSKRSGR